MLLGTLLCLDNFELVNLNMNRSKSPRSKDEITYWVNARYGASLLVSQLCFLLLDICCLKTYGEEYIFKSIN
jgi:hypothetical protein